MVYNYNVTYTTLIDQIKNSKLAWFGHVTRMEGNRQPEVALYTDKWREAREQEAEEDNQVSGWTTCRKSLDDLKGTRNEHERNGLPGTGRFGEVLLRPHRLRTPDGGEHRTWNVT